MAVLQGAQGRYSEVTSFDYVICDILCVHQEQLWLVRPECAVHVVDPLVLPSRISPHV